MGQAKSKVMPAHQKLLEEELERWSRKKYKKKNRRTFVMLLRVLLNRYGGRRHPVLDSFETLMKRRLLTELSFVPRGSVIIYISHQWVGINHPDPRGDQFYHLVLLLERLLRGDIDRTDMDAFHSLLYKHNYTTTSEEWKCMLNPEKTFIFYDGFCVSKEERDGKRISTATPIQHEMWLISLENLLMLYGEGSNGYVMEVHQELKRQEFLTPWCDDQFTDQSHTHTHLLSHTHTHTHIDSSSPPNCDVRQNFKFKLRHTIYTTPSINHSLNQPINHTHTHTHTHTHPSTSYPKISKIFQKFLQKK